MLTSLRNYPNNRSQREFLLDRTITDVHQGIKLFLLRFSLNLVAVYLEWIRLLSFKYEKSQIQAASLALQIKN